jgi:glutathionyl-hydroquinone reductase
MSVRTSYISPILLTILFALGLRFYLQTGNESKITDWVNPNDKSGEFKRGQSAFRNFVSRKPGAEFPPEKDRYHLYVSYACPWGMIVLHRYRCIELVD